MYESLPDQVRGAARKQFAIFEVDPFHASLQFKKLRGYASIWSARVSKDYRVVGSRRGDVVTWYWIGSHADYDRDFG